MSYRSLLVAVLAVIVFSFSSRAAVIHNYTLSPDDLNVVNGFGYDPDQPKPDSIVDGSGNFGSFAAYVTGYYGPPAPDGNNGDKRYTSFRFTPDAVGMSGLTLGQIQSLAYDSRKDGGSVDWQMKVYTTGGMSWYNNRVNFYPDNSNHPFQRYTLTGDTVTESIRNKDTGNEQYNLTFSDIQAAHGSEPVLFFDISAGYDSDFVPSNSFLDNISVTADLGDGVVVANIDAVPEPASVGALGLALVGFLCRARR